MDLSTSANRAAILDALRVRCGRGDAAPVASALATGLTSVDAHLPGGGLARGAVHEWVGVLPPRGVEPSHARTRAAWVPALSFLAHVTRAGFAACRAELGCVVWIGGAVAIHPPVLTAYAPHCAARDTGSGLLGSSLLIRASLPADRLWAADLALRSGACAIVVADGSCFDMSATRRLQLAAESTGGLCLLARPPWEQGVLSAAASRWLVRRSTSPNTSRRWTVELLRCKGMRPASLAVLGRPWVVERDHATRTLRVVADVCNGLGETAVDKAGAVNTSAPPPARRTG